MIQLFDLYGRFEKQLLTLCNPNKEKLAILGLVQNVTLTPKLNDLSELKFKILKDDQGYYDLVQSKRLIYVDEQYGYFLIQEVQETLDAQIYKEVTAYSLEIELTFKKFDLTVGTYKFYDPLNPDKTIMNEILKIAKGWSVGHIDSDLWNLYRTFDVVNSNIYNFLMNEVEKAYECVFSFNTIDKTITAKVLKNISLDTDIFLSFNNLLKEITVEEKSDELVTALKVSGGGDLDIRAVNPIGTDFIYDFSYFKRPNWMSQGLITTVTNWENLIKTKQPVYSNLLTQLKTKNTSIIVLSSERVDLNTAYLALEGVQKSRIEQGIPYADITTQMNAKRAEINAKDVQIETAKTEAEKITTDLKKINTDLSFEKCFTVSQLSELDSYIVENSYQNDAYIQTSAMTTVDIQNMAQDLYEHGVETLSRMSQPRFTFSITSSNFVLMKDFLSFTEQLELGYLITIELEDGRHVKPILLQYEIDYDQPDSFTLTFGNRYRLDGGEFSFVELFGQTVSAGNTVSYGKIGWEESTLYVEDTVSKFIESSLDCAKNNIINAENQEIIINQNGLKGRKIKAGTKNYELEQCWLTSNTLAFTKDGWNTASLALGKIALPDGSSSFGVVGDVIIGKLLAGNQLTITNEKNTFILDGNGATLTNGTLSVITGNGNNRILLDPANGFKIQKKISNVWNDQFYVDTNGNVIFKGTLSGANGTFSGNLSGATITGGSINIGNGNFTVDSNGSVVATSIDIKGGSLGNLTVSGTLRGGSIIGTNITGSTISGNTISGGTITGTTISGGTLNVNNINISGTIAWGNINTPSDLAYTGDIENISKNTMNKYGIGTTTIGMTTISAPTIIGGTITGAIVQSRATSDGRGKGVALRNSDVRFYDDNSFQIGRMYFDTGGTGEIEEARDRLIYETVEGIAMRIESSGNLGIKSKGGKIFMGNVKFTGTVEGISGGTGTAVFG